MTMLRSAANWVLIFAAALAFFGCAGGPQTAESDRTGGVSLELFVKASGGAFSLYRVGADGSVSFGGAWEATQGKTIWTGDLTDQEIAELQRLLDEHGWLNGKPAPGEGDLKYRISLHSPKNSYKLTMAGPSPQVEPIRELLDRASRRRFDPILQALPKPGEQK